jgi:hypothetical protein
VFAALLLASERLRAGDRDAAATHLRAAIAAADDDTAAYGAGARHRLAALAGGDEGRALAAEAAATFARLGIRSPAVIADLLIPA